MKISHALVVTLLCGVMLSCTSDPVNPEVPKFQHRSDGSTFVVAADGCEYDLRDNGTMTKHDPDCKAK